MQIYFLQSWNFPLSLNHESLTDDYKMSDLDLGRKNAGPVGGRAIVTVLAMRYSDKRWELGQRK